MHSFNHVLDQIRQESPTMRDRGTRFECLVQEFLRVASPWRERFDEVWRWDLWPGRDGKPDTGIDLVARERASGKFCAVQCKFYSSDTVVSREDIDPFFTASGREPFSHRLIVCTGERWGRHAEDALRGQRPPVSRLTTDDFINSGVDWSRFSPVRPDVLTLREVHSLRPHQRAALDAVAAGFRTADRGKLIMACGTGKTLTALRIAEELVPSAGLVVVLVPSIALISQTLREWTTHARRGVRCFAVCSDSRVGRRSEDYSVHDLAWPATTKGRDLAVGIASGSADMTVIFSTFQSSQVLAEAQELGMPAFDLMVCDEAHRTTGVTLRDEEKSAAAMPRT